MNYKEPDKEPIPNFKVFNVFDTHLNRRTNQEIHFELGRSIIAQAGLLSKVLFIKKEVKTFVIIDAGMTELIRPALYQATHQIDRINTAKINSNIQKKYDVVGPICESSDTFAQNYSLPVLQRGDLLAIRSAGAYGQVMKSQYNLRPDFPVIYSDDLVNNQI